MTGARVGNWFVEAEVGRGPLGPVYKARHFDHPDRLAAVKLLDHPAARDPALPDKLTSELLALRRLDHPNVAPFLDTGTHAGVPFVAAEWADGTDLAKLLEAGRRPWAEVLAVAVQVARALKHAHNRNVLHRDLKPAHLLLTPDGTVKVLSFGLARVVPPVLAATPPVGSAAYLPPETAGGKPPTRRADLYSLGGVLYTLVTGRPPFAAGSLVELTHKQCYALPERPGMLVPDLPPEVDEFICSLLAKDPARRPASAQAVLDELERVRGKLDRKGQSVAWPAKLKPDTAEMVPLADGLAPPDPEPAEPPRRRWRWELPTAAGVLAVLLLGGLVGLLPTGDEAELRRAVGEGASVGPRSDAERGYRRGLALARAGDPVAARRVWAAVVTAFDPVPSEERWVTLSRTGLGLLGGAGTVPPKTDRRPLDAALAHAKTRTGPDADAALAALEELTRDDPAAAEMVRQARPK